MKLRDTLLLVEGTESSQAALCKIFNDSFNLLVAETSAQAMMLVKQNRDSIAAVLLDIKPPKNEEDDYPVLSEMNRLGFLEQIPVITITDVIGTGENEIKAFKCGAAEVITKPYLPPVVFRRVQAIVELYRNRWHLQDQIEEQANKLRHANDVMVDALSAMIEYRSSESGKHVLRIRRFVQILLEDIAKSYPEYELNDDLINTIASASALHDIGKISIPDAILNKPGKLTEEEFEIMKSHTINGCKMLENLTGMGNEDYLRYAYNICRYHHERWDGNGYPEGLKGNQIPICAQVSGLADAYDALTTKRVYKDAYSHKKAINMILNGECGIFSPPLLECLKNVQEELGALAHQYADDTATLSDFVTEPLPAPSPKNQGVDTLQMAQRKYETLIHHMNATIMEMDLDKGIYHIIYNPNPDFSEMRTSNSFEQALSEMTRNGIHPDDWEMVWQTHKFFFSTFFEENLRKYTFHYRIFSPAADDYKLYKVTFLRLDIDASNHRKALVLWEPSSKPAPLASPVTPDLIQNNEVLQGIVSTVIRCLNDKWFTILDGSPTLSRLLGYSLDEFTEVFHNHFLEVILEEDRENVQNQIKEQLAFSTQTEVEYRLRHKDGHIIWILEKNRLVIDSDGKEFFYCALTDNSKSKEAQEKLQWSLKRHEIIRDQTDDIIFEWDLTDNSVICSSKWEQRFGYPPFTRSVYSMIPLSAHFHPDDLPTFKSHMEIAKEQSAYLDTEVRILSSSGRYLWNRIRTTFLHEGNEKAYKAVGVIIDVDQEKQAAQNLVDRAARDTLTKLLNKESSRAQIDLYLQTREKEDLSALLVIDMDNFKLVNDRFGHLFGDAVLIQAAVELNNLFRSEDIVARIGGDEFMVFMKHVPNRDLVEERCRKLVIKFQNLYREQLEECHLSCSIGIAFVPKENLVFHELFQQADQALYMAKRRGKSCHVIYNDNGEMPFLSKHESAARIDSDERSGLEDDTLVRYVFQKLHETDDIEETIQSTMQLIGQQMNVSRIYVLENSPDNENCSNTYEWCNEGISSQIANLQMLIYGEDVPDYQSKFDSQGIFYCSDIRNLSEKQQSILRPQGIKSLLHCAIVDNGIFQGYVGFDECNRNRLWTKEDVRLLSFFAKLLAIFLKKNRSRDMQSRMERQLRQILDQQNAWMYIVNDDYSIRFINKKLRLLMPNIQEGEKCYKTIMKQDGPCGNCPAFNIKKLKMQEAIVNNADLGLRVRAEATLINWESEDACLITCHALDDGSNRSDD